MKSLCVKGLLLLLSLLTVSCARPRPETFPRTDRAPETTLKNIPPRTVPPAEQPARGGRPALFDTMIARAEKQLGRNEPAAAFQTLERALSIDGQAPLVWHLMAKARLDQGNFDQAQSLARKSNTLAGRRPDLKKKNWRIIARALEKQGKPRAAADAWARGQ